MNKECSIVKDLLPLYAEKLTAPETGEFIEEHLKTCPDCRALLAGLSAPAQNALPEEEAAAPLKTVKKKLRRKRLLIAAGAVLATAVLLFGGFLFLDSRPTDSVILRAYQRSEMYPESVIREAQDALERDFKNMEGCKLYALTYAGDEKCKEGLAYINELGRYDQCIVFESVFRSPLFGGGAWEAHSIYTWSWYLGRVYGGEWEVVTKGEA